MPENILGFYSYQQNRIVLDIASNRDLNSSITTCMHEIQHMYLDHITHLGFVKQVLNAEALATKNSQMRHTEECVALAAIVHQAMREVHEVYATNMQLLFVEDRAGPNARQEEFSGLPDRYKEYYLRMDAVHCNPKFSVGMRRDIVHLLCCHALNIPIASDVFMQALSMGPRAASRYLGGKRDPSVRLEAALDLYEADRMDDLDFSSGIQREGFVNRLVGIGLLQKQETSFRKMLLRFRSTAIPHKKQDEELWDQFHNIAPALHSSLSGADSIWGIYEKQVSVYAPSTLRMVRGIPFGEDSKECFLFTQQSSYLKLPGGFYLVGHKAVEHQAVPVGREVSGQQLLKLLQNKAFAAIQYGEYNMQTHKPEAIDAPGVVFVILLQYRHCQECLEELTKQGRLWMSDVLKPHDSFFSIAIFRLADRPDRLFAFPTLRTLAEKLLKHFAPTIYPASLSHASSSTFFSVFPDAQTTQFTLHWLYGLFTQRVAELDLSNKGFGSIVGTDALAAFYKQRKKRGKPVFTAPPAVKAGVKGAPFYAIMERIDGQLTGSIHVNRERYPIFFLSSEEAQQYINLHAAPLPISPCEPFGICKKHWCTFEKDWINRGDELRIALCTNPEKKHAVYLTVKQVSQCIGLEGDSLQQALIEAIRQNESLTNRE